MFSALVAAGAALAVQAPVAHAADNSARQLREDLRFAAEMAEKGLWREAMFRWRRALESRPNDPALHNNIAVALEALGRHDEALAEYEKSLSIVSTERVRTNYELARRALELSRDADDEDDLAADGETEQSAAGARREPAR